MKITKTETGLIVMKGDMAWIGADPQFQSPSDGWGHPAAAKLHSPEFFKKPSDILSPGDHFCIKEINTGKIVTITRTVTIEVKE